MPEPTMCSNSIVLMRLASSSGLSMDWADNNMGWVTGSNGIIMKYTANTPEPKTVSRCLACGTGKCYTEPLPDGGVGDAGKPDGSTGEDASMKDSGPPDAGPTNLIPRADLKLCVKDGSGAESKGLDMVVAFAQRTSSGGVELYIFPGYSSVTLGQAIDTAAAGGPDTQYFWMSIGMPYAVTSLAIQAGEGAQMIPLTTSNTTAELVEEKKDVWYFNVGSFKTDLADSGGTPAGTFEGWISVPVLSVQQVNGLRANTLESLFNNIRRPCEEGQPDASVEDGSVPVDDSGTAHDGGQKKDSGGTSGASGGCGCSTTDGDEPGSTAAWLICAAAALAIALSARTRGRNG
jgi:hypothetical protein